MPTFPSRFTTSRRASGIVVFFALVSVLSSPGQAGQSRAVSDRVYSDAQAARGQQLYKAQCVMCHGEALEGVEEAVVGAVASVHSLSPGV